jgi:hypothetical protein
MLKRAIFKLQPDDAAFPNNQPLSSPHLPSPPTQKNVVFVNLSTKTELCAANFHIFSEFSKKCEWAENQNRADPFLGSTLIYLQFFGLFIEFCSLFCLLNIPH